MPEFVPSPARLYDPVSERLVAAEGMPVDAARIPELITERELHQRWADARAAETARQLAARRAEPAGDEPQPVSAKRTRARTRARQPGENRGA
jgi:hypothetical protein